MLMCGGQGLIFTMKTITWQDTSHCTREFSSTHHSSTSIMSTHIFNQKYNVLICKTHQHAISLRYITRHFLEEHNVSGSVRQAIQAYASQYMAREAAELLYSSERIQPIPYLRIINGF